VNTLHQPIDQGDLDVVVEGEADEDVVKIEATEVIEVVVDVVEEEAVLGEVEKMTSLELGFQSLN
jgi:hypothetical protein